MSYILDDDLLRRLKKETCICPKCKSQFSFESAASFAKFNHIKENVVMCEKCHRVYEIELKGECISLKKDVTKIYPWIRVKKSCFRALI